MSEEAQRLSEYSTRTNVNAMNIALVQQSMAIVERRLEEYQQRLHLVEDEKLVIKTVQQIHDTQIQAMRKILIGNGDRETIPMDMDRMERAIAEILKIDHKDLQSRLKVLEERSTGIQKLWDFAIGAGIAGVVSWMVQVILK